MPHPAPQSQCCRRLGLRLTPGKTRHDKARRTRPHSADCCQHARGHVQHAHALRHKTAHCQPRCAPNSRQTQHRRHARTQTLPGASIQHRPPCTRPHRRACGGERSGRHTRTTPGGCACAARRCLCTPRPRPAPHMVHAPACKAATACATYAGHARAPTDTHTHTHTNRQPLQDSVYPRTRPVEAVSAHRCKPQATPQSSFACMHMQTCTCTGARAPKQPGACGTVGLPLPQRSPHLPQAPALCHPPHHASRTHGCTLVSECLAPAPQRWALCAVRMPWGGCSRQALRLTNTQSLASSQSTACIKPAAMAVATVHGTQATHECQPQSLSPAGGIVRGCPRLAQTAVHT
jgi:hypothetical protein